MANDIIKEFPQEKASADMTTDRLARLLEYGLAKGEEDDELGNMVSLFAELLGFPTAFVSLITEEEQFFKAKTGLEFSCTSRDDAFCRYVVDRQAPLVVNDASRHKDFANNPFVLNAPNVRSYAGVPLELDSTVVGAVAVMDYQPREITDAQLTALKRFSQHISHHLCLLKDQHNIKREHALLDESQAVILRWCPSNGFTLSYISVNIESLFGLPHSDLISGEAHFSDFLEDKGKDELNFIIQNHLKGMEAYETHLKICTPQQKTFWVKVLSKGFFNAEGRLEAINMLLLDDTQNKYIEKKLHHTNRQMKLLLEASELGTWDVNLPADINKVNTRWCEMLGLERDDVDSSIDYWRTLLHPADKTRVERDLNNHLEGRSERYNTAYRMRHANGSWVWIETYGKVVEYDEDQQPVRLAGTHRDITERKRTELVEQKQKQLLSFVNKAQAEYLKNADLAKACQQILPELIDIADSQFGFIGQIRTVDDNQALLIRAISELSWNDDSAGLVKLFHEGKLYFRNFDNLFGRVITSEDIVLSNDPMGHPSAKGLPPGHPRILNFLGLPIMLGDRIIGMIGLANKFTDYQVQDAHFLQPLLDALASLFYAVDLEDERRRMENRLKNLAMTDTLTGIPNRRAFFEHFDIVAGDPALNHVVAIVDIDHFKKINDTHGHAAGDSAIRQVSAILQHALRPDDYVARIGGEEFAVLITTDDTGDAASILETLRSAVEQATIRFEELELKVTISLGADSLATTDSPEDALRQSLSNADKALYESKANGRNRVSWST